MSKPLPMAVKLDNLRQLLRENNQKLQRVNLRAAIIFTIASILVGVAIGDDLYQRYQVRQEQQSLTNADAWIVKVSSQLDLTKAALRQERRDLKAISQAFYDCEAAAAAAKRP